MLSAGNEGRNIKTGMTTFEILLFLSRSWSRRMAFCQWSKWTALPLSVCLRNPFTKSRKTISKQSHRGISHYPQRWNNDHKGPTASQCMQVRGEPAHKQHTGELRPFCTPPSLLSPQAIQGNICHQKRYFVCAGPSLEGSSLLDSDV